MLLNLTARKLVVCRADRPELPHLTLSWGNVSGEVDLHLTPQSASSAADRIPLARASAVELLALVKEYGEAYQGALREAAEQALVRRRVVRPGWLGRKGYLIFVLTKEDNERNFEVIRGLFPKRRRRYHVDVGAWKSETFREHMAQFLYPPEVLHILRDWPRGETDIQIQAVPRRRGLPKLWLYHTQDQKGRHRWCAVDERPIARAMFQAIGAGLHELSLRISPDHLAVASAVYDGLGLQDIDEMRNVLEGLHNMVQDPARIFSRVTRLVHSL